MLRPWITHSNLQVELKLHLKLKILFMNQPKEDKCLGFEPVGKMTDSQLAVLIQQEYQRTTGELNTDECRELIRSLYKQNRGSIRQLARVFGVSKGVVERAVR